MYFIAALSEILLNILIGMTIVAKNDYCDSIDRAGSTIVILLLLWTTIAILLQYYCMKHLCMFEGENYRYHFLYGNKRNISEYCQSPLILLKCMGGHNIIHPIAI